MNLNPFSRLRANPKSRRSIETALGAARVRLEQLEAAVRLASFDAVDPDDALATQRLSDAKVARAAMQSRIKDLEAALPVAIEHEAAEERARVAEEVANRTGEVLDRLAERDRYAVELQSALEAADRAYRGLIQAGEAAQRAIPTVRLPDVGAVTLPGVRQLVSIAMFRELGGDGEIEPPFKFPFVRAPGWEAVNDPKSLPTLASQFADATAAVRTFLNPENSNG